MLMELKNLVKIRLSVVHYENWWDELNKKSKCDLYQKIQLDDIANVKSMKKGFKLASGTHGLRLGLSPRDNGSNICICCDLDKDESVEHFSLECPLYNKIREKILLQIMYSSGWILKGMV
eukprot:Awhi_evm1s7775